MTVYGYWRCSTDLQDQERQIVALKKMQCESIYGDHITGKSNNEISKLLERGIHIKTLDKRLDTTSMPKEITMLIVSILGYAASQELEQIKSRTAEGREVAKTRGVKFGRKRTYDKYQIEEILSKRKEGQGYGTIARSMGMHRGTVQKIINRENAMVGIQ